MGSILHLFCRFGLVVVWEHLLFSAMMVLMGLIPNHRRLSTAIAVFESDFEKLEMTLMG